MPKLSNVREHDRLSRHILKWFTNTAEYGNVGWQETAMNATFAMYISHRVSIPIALMKYCSISCLAWAHQMAHSYGWQFDNRNDDTLITSPWVSAARYCSWSLISSSKLIIQHTVFSLISPPTVISIPLPILINYFCIWYSILKVKIQHTVSILIIAPALINAPSPCAGE